ncbi:hypothetical protein DENIS_0810 [Desulfonema ishimotonii]|uniref:histidine kinase n=1 Tax=Desulfonema ishimotonii TaxID=45657 RepID=A0A401FSC6_9BACT|nr:ATP-binding protein [Desulfonema ishimotonii]GBC59869.1 hypothetical protein DENIS_0810 [Desulfonema ishimotonii]
MPLGNHILYQPLQVFQLANGELVKSDGDFYHKLKWLMFFRVLFTTLLLGSTFILHMRTHFAPVNTALLVLYELIGGLFFLSLVYTLLLRRIRRIVLFAYIQIAVDTTVVTLIIFLTGSFSSLFSFLYLVVIIYASIILFKGGSMVMAALCSIQYGILVDLEFYGVLQPFGFEENLIASDYAWSYVLFKIITIMVGCFGVAFLSGLLADQARKSKKELMAMESHVKRVEKMAAVGEMAAGLAHEIKNPLASLRGAIQMLSEEVRYDAAHERLMTIILREADRLGALVNDFLMFAKPPAGKPERVDLSTVLAETIAIFEKDRGNFRDIRISREISPDIWVEMDSGHLRQIFWNLLLNAGEAITDEGHIDIRTYPVRDKYAEVEIRDDGCGIPEKLIRTIFDPFVTTKPGGTGLGLSIVHRIVESYDGGRLDVVSKEGEGTLFRLRLVQSPPPADKSSAR